MLKWEKSNLANKSNPTQILSNPNPNTDSRKSNTLNHVNTIQIQFYFWAVNTIQIQIQFHKLLYWILNLQIRIWICGHLWLGSINRIVKYVMNDLMKKRYCDVPGSTCLSKTGPVYGPFFLFLRIYPIKLMGDIRYAGYFLSVWHILGAGPIHNYYLSLKSQHYWYLDPLSFWLGA